MTTIVPLPEANDAENMNRMRLEIELLKSENNNLRTELFQAGENLKYSHSNISQLNLGMFCFYFHYFTFLRLFVFNL